jgi:hypothetical protein
MFCPKTYGTGLENIILDCKSTMFHHLSFPELYEGKVYRKIQFLLVKSGSLPSLIIIFPHQNGNFFRVLRPRPEAPLRVSACGAPAAPAEALGEPAQAGQKGPKN